MPQLADKDRARMKDTTLQLRLNTEQKATIERAAALRGASVSSYMLANSLKAAQEEIAYHERISLSKADWGLFMSALENPPKPNQALRKAAQEFKKKYG